MESAGKTSGTKGRGMNFDKVDFQSTSRQIKEKIYTEDITKEIRTQVLGVKDKAERISELKTEIRSGAYIADPQEITARILLRGGES